jgi:hypothetical protein
VDDQRAVSVQFRANEDLLVYYIRFSGIRYRDREPVLSGGNENNPKLPEMKLQKRMKQHLVLRQKEQRHHQITLASSKL